MSAGNISGSVRFISADPTLGDIWMNGLPIDVVGQIANLLTGVNADAAVKVLLENCLSWRGPVAEGAAGGWLLSGVTGAATIVETATRGGEIALTASADANADPTLQLGNTTAHMPFFYTVGKRMWCFVRLKIGTVASTEMFIGMGTADAEPTTTNTFPSDGIFFHKASTGTKFSFDARKDGVSTSKANIGTTLADGVYTVIGFTVDALGNIQPYQDGAAVAAGLIAAGTANIPSTAGDTMTFMVGFRGQSQVVTMSMILLGQEV